MCSICSCLSSSKERTWATAACPFELRIEVASHSNRSWFMELLGRTYPEAGRASAPYLWSFRHTPTRALAFAVGRVKTSKSHAAEPCLGDTLIAAVDTHITLYCARFRCLRAISPFLQY